MSTKQHVFGLEFFKKMILSTTPYLEAFVSEYSEFGKIHEGFIFGKLHLFEVS